jgi:hypothetical protein
MLFPAVFTIKGHNSSWGIIKAANRNILAYYFQKHLVIYANLSSHLLLKFLKKKLIRPHGEDENKA